MRRLLLAFWVSTSLFGQKPDLAFLDHNRSVLDAHNCYPYEGQWRDRLQRALSTGRPVAIEQDLAWYVDPKTGAGRIAVTHSAKTNGSEPGLRDYFFEPVRPVIEQALRENRQETWPLVILHFDFKDNRRELLQAVWKLLGEYEDWMVTAEKSGDPRRLHPMTRRPLLVLTEDSDEQEKVFFSEVPEGGRLRLFGSAHTRKNPGKDAGKRAHLAATMKPEQLLAEHPTNYRRWWNNSWAEVEEGGQTKAGDWTAADNRRLRALVDRAHELGFWIRFYTLDGFTAAEDKGWTASYNFGSRAAVEIRWRAAMAAGVDLIATDQYEDLDSVMNRR